MLQTARMPEDALALMSSNEKRTYRTLPPPKNGKFYVCLIAGAPADRAREIRDALAKRRGVLASYHWDYKRPNAFDREIPVDVDFVLIIKSMIGHDLAEKVRSAAKRSGTRFTFVPHKWTSISVALAQRFGLLKSEPLPLVISSFSYFKEQPIEDEVESVPEPPPPPSSPEVEVPPVDLAPTPEGEVLRIHPILAGAQAALLQNRTPLHPSVETVTWILAVQARLRVEGVDSVLISPHEIIIGGPKT